LVQADRRPKWAGLAVPGLAVPDTRTALAHGAAAFLGWPARRLTVIGVTGTDGKTTTVHLIAHVLESAGRPAGYLSSAAFKTNGEPETNASHMTTLEAPDVQGHLAAMVEARLRYADRVHATACVRCGPSGKPALVGSPWSLKHQHEAAKRYTVKMFLKELWIASRQDAEDAQNPSAGGTE